MLMRQAKKALAQLELGKKPLAQKYAQPPPPVHPFARNPHKLYAYANVDYATGVTYPCCSHVKFSVFATAFLLKDERDLTDTQQILQRPIILTRLFHQISGRNRAFNDNIFKMRFVRSIRTPADCYIFFSMLLLPHTGMYHSPYSSF